MKAQLVNGPVARMTIDTVTEESAESINELNQVIGLGAESPVSRSSTNLSKMVSKLRVERPPHGS